MKWGLLSVLLLIGCANGQHGVGEFSYFGSDENYPAVVAAAREWDKCGIVILVDKSGSNVPIIEVDNIDNNNPHVLGRTYLKAPNSHPEWIKFVKSNPDIVQGVMEHEFGHAMGHRSTHTFSGVMQPHWLTGSVALTDCWYISDSL